MAIKPAKKKEDKSVAKKPAETKKADAPAKLVPQSRDQLFNELIGNHKKVAKTESEIVEAEAQLNELKAEKKKLEARQKSIMDNLSSGQTSLAVGSQDSVMDKSNYKTPEEMKRHPHAEPEGKPDGKSKGAGA